MPEPKTGREQALAVMQDYRDEKMSFYSCLERLGDIESDEFFGDDHLDEEDDEELIEDEDGAPLPPEQQTKLKPIIRRGDAGHAGMTLVLALFALAFVVAVLGLIGSTMESKTEHKITCNAATKQVDGSFASNCDSYGEYYDSGAP